MGQEVRLDAYATVANLNHDVVIETLGELNRDCPTSVGELDRVREQIPHDLLQPLRITLDVLR